MVAEKNERMRSYVGTVRKLSAEERVAQICEERSKYLSDVATLKDCLEEATKKLAEVSERANQESERANQASERAKRIEEENRQLRQQLEQLQKSFD